MKRIETALPGVLLLEPKLFGDERGFFMETYQRDNFREMGIDATFVQDNHSRSARNTVRGLHFQLAHPQTKLCRVVAGEVLDVVVDVRLGSPTFGRHMSAVLSEENKRQILVPRGFAHGFAVLSDYADFLYKCDDYYHPEDEGGIAWDDPDLGIDWHVENPILSARDRLHPPLATLAAPALPAYSPLPS